MTRPVTQPKRKSLMVFAKTHELTPAGTKAWITTIPEKDECIAAYQEGVSLTTIRAWLADECGYGEKATRNRVERWLREHGKTAR